MNKINEDVNYRKMAGNSRLFIISESSHHPAAYKYEAIRALKELKKAGFTHFAMEMLPLSLREKVNTYQQTGKGLETLKHHFDQNWSWTSGAATGYLELVKAASSLGLKVVPLDMPIELMDIIENKCNWNQVESEGCRDSHTHRNYLWAEIINETLSKSPQYKVVAYMHRYHAFKAGVKHLGMDSIMRASGVNRIRVVDYVGGLACFSKSYCEGQSDEEGSLSQQYFYKKGSAIDSRLPTFTVHLPERKVSQEGALSW
ncbi:hypothetical protein MHM95_05755 [Pseudoalteromonas sp. CnMc7-15]|uniref:hypothetical protein n=1 Tax=unclassified Pseudoalteromonas TaxID=194690 RepID=UPI001EF5C940|nr:hypothetical protein [Pseudoalteromonas sp. CnMc7-15]MCG7565790.1 hypothetical protein [Pseudoalteromonas sp. CnMc7-15]